MLIAGFLVQLPFASTGQGERYEWLSHTAHKIKSNHPLHVSPSDAIAQWLMEAEEVQPAGLKRPVLQWNQTCQNPQDAPVSSGQQDSSGHPLPGSMLPLESSSRTVRVSHLDAHRLLSSCALNEDYYDLVDIDSFGSDTSFLGAAIETVK